MSQMTMTKEMVEWLKQFDSLPVKSDKKSDLIWKAAQREIYERAKALHEKQVHGTLSKKERKAAELGFNLRPRED